jgi:hypothetical protein
VSWMSGITALVNLSSGDLTIPCMALLGSPQAVAARTQLQRADGVLVRVDWLGWTRVECWLCGVESSRISIRV